MLKGKKFDAFALLVTAKRPHKTDSICRSITLPLHRKNSGFKKSVIQKRTQEHRNSIVWYNHLQQPSSMQSTFPWRFAVSNNG